ncbi:hypothetical protein EDC01DRAFT_699917 [Geopyxis carbonaria]|nr:hypothetical protein EDC01DRAFT_699917 [Geopyxis carbonaria]
MDANTDLYEILGVTSAASKTEIKKAYHKAALSSHPDKVPVEERHEAEMRFKSVSQAYEILYDDDTRERYDRHGMAAFQAGAGPGDGAGVDLDDLLSQMFMGGMGGMGGMPGMGGMGGMGGMPGGRPRRQQRGADVQQEYEVTLEELYKGKTVKLASTRNKLCGTCSGSGGKEKAKPKKCAACSGRGWIQTARQVGAGLITQETVACGSCSGTGEVFRDKDRCKRCKGACVVEEKKVLEIYIPRGARAGERIVLEAEADEKPGFTTGNIVFVLAEKEHAVFTRSGADLAAPLHVSLAEALTGFSRIVLRHLDGRGIRVTHPAGKVLRPGQVLKVEGEGMPHKKGDGRGDLFLQVEIEFPKDGWTPDAGALRGLLPVVEHEDIVADPVDDVEYEDADMDDYGNEEAWEDDEEDDEGEGEGVQCAQQ